LLNARVEEQRQTTGRAALSFGCGFGLALFNLFDTAGMWTTWTCHDCVCLNSLELPSGGAERRWAQSHRGLTVMSATFLARAPVLIRMGFYVGGGGCPVDTTATTLGDRPICVSSRFLFDWEKTAVIAGLDTPFFSPNPRPRICLWRCRVSHRWEFVDLDADRFALISDSAGLDHVRWKRGRLIPPSNINYTTKTIACASPTESCGSPLLRLRFSSNIIGWASFRYLSE